MAFSLNGEFLQDSLGSNIAFEGVVKGMALVPAITLAAGQRAQLNFGRSEVHQFHLFQMTHIYTLYFTLCRKLYAMTILH